MINNERSRISDEFIRKIREAKLSRVEWYNKKSRDFSLSSLNYYLSGYPQHERTSGLVKRDIEEWMERENELL